MDYPTQDKVQKEDLEKVSNLIGKTNINNKNIEEATTALEVLGYAKRDISAVIDSLNITNENVEDIIRIVLKEMQK